jgi:thioredoxin 1
MKKNVIIAFTFLLIFINSCQQGNSQTAKTSLTATEFDAKVKELATAPLIDVRTPDEYSKGHLANSKNIDWNGTSFDQEIQKLDKSKPVLVYCLSGGRSGAAAAKMRADGFKEVYELEGGIMKWRAAGLPETTTDATANSTGMTKEQFNALLETDKTVLIDFYADWCGPCKKMKPYLDEISKDMAKNVVVVRINVDENISLSKEMKIEALPTLHVYKKKALTWSNIGYIEKADVVKQL